MALCNYVLIKSLIEKTSLPKPGELENTVSGEFSL